MPCPMLDTQTMPQASHLYTAYVIYFQIVKTEVYNVNPLLVSLFVFTENLSWEISMCHGWLETTLNIFWQTFFSRFLRGWKQLVFMFMLVAYIPLKWQELVQWPYKKWWIMHFIITGHFNTSRKIEMGIFFLYSNLDNTKTTSQALALDPWSLPKSSFSTNHRASKTQVVQALFLVKVGPSCKTKIELYYNMLPYSSTTLLLWSPNRSTST